MDKSSKSESKYGRKALPDSKKRKPSNILKFECSDAEYNEISDYLTNHYPNFEKNKAYCIRDFLLTCASKKTNVNFKYNDLNKGIDSKFNQRIVYELNRIGNNINQISKRINSNKSEIDRKELYNFNATSKELKTLKLQLIEFLISDS